VQRNKVILIGVCVAAIVIAIVWTVKRGTSVSEAPGEVYGAESTYLCGGCGAEVTLSLKEWLALPVDLETSYRKCPKCGAMKLWVPITCLQCGARIIGPPPPKTEEEDDTVDPVEVTYYKCPKCGKNALGAPR